MKMNDIQNHYEAFSEWLRTLKELKDDLWLVPISEGKWPVRAVIAHLLYWDRYSINERFPFFKEGAKLDKFPDFQKVNDQAAEYSKNVSKEKLLDELLSIRQQFVSMINQMNEDELEVAFHIGDHKLTIKDYFKDFIEHDLHHKEQVNRVIGQISSN
ncbi:DinB family protein [Bacillus sp. JJ1532]|uniref:DinB family protein n=1 Tax=Bacillus sp. JJ1532 TaxID=3122958 RepID=UPI002FFF4EF4